MADLHSCNAVRELSCRLCLCSDIVELKPLSAELKRKLLKLFNIHVRLDDNLPKAICHDCLQQIGAIHRYSVKVEKTQNFLQLYQNKNSDKNIEKKDEITPSPQLMYSEHASAQSHEISQLKRDETSIINTNTQITASSDGQIRKRALKFQPRSQTKRKPLTNMHREAMSLEEFVKTEGVDHVLLVDSDKSADPLYWRNNAKPKNYKATADLSNEVLDPIVLINGKPAKQGAALDRQISLFYKMECMICHETGFHYKALMHHYKEGHGVPGYVTCCDKKFHHFSLKKIVEHMAYHLQPSVFMCDSCHENFQSSLELSEHRANGGRSLGRLVCPRCTERYPTWREFGRHLVAHRADPEAEAVALPADAAGLTPPADDDPSKGKQRCDYCGKWLKHHHRKKNVNGMESLILCSPCTRAIKKKASAELNKDLAVRDY